MQLAKPGLYGGEGAGQPARLRLSACSRCGTVNFPANVPGCRECGAPAEDLQPHEHDGRGTLRAFVTLHQPLAPGVQTPCVIGEVDFGAGVIEEIVLDCDSEDGLEIGMTGHLVLQPVKHGEAGLLAARFRPAMA